METKIYLACKNYLNSKIISCFYFVQDLYGIHYANQSRYSVFWNFRFPSFTHTLPCDSQWTLRRIRSKRSLHRLRKRKANSQFNFRKRIHFSFRTFCYNSTQRLKEKQIIIRRIGVIRLKNN